MKTNKQNKKTRSATRISLAYCPNSNHSTLYSPGTGQLDYFEKLNGFAMTVGSVFRDYPSTPKEVGFYWMIHFHHAVVRDGVCAKSLHKTLCEIPEFRDLCADDVPEIYKYFEEDEKYR